MGHPYATQAQIQLAAGGADRFTQLFDWNGDGTADADVIAEAQARADGWIDSFFRGDMVPFAVPSDAIIRISADEACHWARGARGMAAVDQLDLDRRKDRERQLEAMRDGKQRPDTTSTGPEPGGPIIDRSAAGSIVSCDIESAITREAMKGSIW